MSATAPILTGKLRLKDETGGTLRSLGSSFRSTFTSIGRIAAGVLARDVVRGLISVGKEAITLGGRLETVQAGFNALTNNIGVGTLSLDTLREAISGTVSDVDLLKTANNALALGLPIDKLNALFSAAQTVGNVMGRSTLDAVNDLATGIGRQSRLILDNLGIIVDVDAAYETYAKTLGKSANGLTDNERKTAFMNFAIKALTQRANQLEGTTSELQIAQEALGATWDNLKAKIGEALIPALVDLGAELLGLIGTVGDLITKIQEEDWAGAWSIIQTTFEEAWTNLNTWIDENIGTIDWSEISTSLKSWIDSVDWWTVWNGFTTFMGGIWDTIKTAWSTAWTIIWDILPTTTEGWLEYWSSFKTMMGGFWVWATGEMDDIDKAFSDWINGTDWAMVKEVFQSVGSDIVTWLFQGMKASNATIFGIPLADLLQIGSGVGEQIGGGDYGLTAGPGSNSASGMRNAYDRNNDRAGTRGEGFTSTIVVEVMAGGNNNISPESSQMISKDIIIELMRRGVIP